MYIPPAFAAKNSAKLRDVMQRFSFALLVTQHEGVPFASHLPLLLDEERGPHGTLVGHMAKANEQWRHFTDEGQALVVFQGPHAYISPRWYETELAVPTWNYVTVHAYGTPRILHDQGQVEGALQRLIQTYEGTGDDAWKSDLPVEFKAKMLNAIVGFEIPIARLEGKWKLGQNRSADDVRGMHEALRGAEDENSRMLAQFMEREIAVLQQEYE
jgi:transcriptional regulator